MKTLKEKIEVMQAALDGKEIESKWLQKGNPEWKSEDMLVFNWVCFDYRIKPEPLEIYIDIYDADTSNPRYEVGSDSNRFKYDGQPFKTIKVREVTE